MKTKQMEKKEIVKKQMRKFLHAWFFLLFFASAYTLKSDWHLCLRRGMRPWQYFNQIISNICNTLCLLWWSLCFGGGVTAALWAEKHIWFVSPVPALEITSQTLLSVSKNIFCTKWFWVPLFQEWPITQAKRKNLIWFTVKILMIYFWGSKYDLL